MVPRLSLVARRAIAITRLELCATSRVAAFSLSLATFSALATLATLATPIDGAAQSLPAGFQESVVFSGLEDPTAVRFASDGRIFAAEKRGVIKVFDSLTDSTPTIFADLNAQVYNYWDRGLLGLALHPGFPGTPFVYVVYTRDFDPNMPATVPRWGTPGVYSDPCPTPPGPNDDGCVVSARLSRLQASGNVMVGAEQVMLDDWCQQFPSHSIGSLAFGVDGALYVSAGDGASFDFPDYGQAGAPLNPCGDPPGGRGNPQTPPTAEGGALRSQDLRTSSDPATLNGAILRVDAMTGNGLPDNPLAGSVDANARRVIAYGLRNPFRFTIKPGSNEVWIGDVGWHYWEEINRIPNPTDAIVENFGWPCYEGTQRHDRYDALNLSLCEALYLEANAVTLPFYAYRHEDRVVPGEACEAGSSSITGLAFYQGGNYPAAYANALFFADYARNCIWVMFAGPAGAPDPSQRATMVAGAASPVDLQIGPGGDLFYVDFLGGAIRRIRFFPANQPPTAVLMANPTNGPAPLTVTFDGRGSRDPDPADTLTYAWDLDGDGQFDDATAACCPTWTYTQPGTSTARLRVADPHGASDTATMSIAAANTPPTVTMIAPAAGSTPRVGDVINFSAAATDAQDGTLPASALSWDVILHHCPTTCHQHPIQSFAGMRSGSFTAPNHDYPTRLEFRLDAVDSGGLRATASVLLPPLIRPTTTTLSSSPNPSTAGQPATFTATIAPSSATGTVAFTRGGSAIAGCGARPISAGTASCTTSVAIPGTFAVVATYGGDQPHEGSTSASWVQTVNAAPTTTSVAAAPNPARVGEPVTLTATVTPSGPTGTVTFIVDGIAVGTAALSGGQAAFSTSNLVVGTHEVIASYAGDATFAASTAAPVMTQTNLFTEYFAEGATGFFHTQVGILNASTTAVADLAVTLFPEGGAPVVLRSTMKPLTRQTIDLNAALGAVPGVSVLVESNRPVAATRTMTWGAPVYGSTLESGIPEPATTWFFAEGATNIFSLFYLVQNASDTPANVEMTHLLEGGLPPIGQTEVVPAHTRRTFFLNAIPGLEGAALSSVIRSTVPIVVERAMYLNSNIRLWEGGTTSRGAAAPSRSWSFAEGSTGFFHMYLLFGNPNAADAEATVRYQWPDGTTLTKTYLVAAQSRRTVDVNFEDPSLRSASIAMSVSSSLPIVAERAMWWGEPWIEGSAVLGSTTTGTVWGIGEGAEGGSASESTFVLVANGSADPGSVRFTVVYDDGTTEQKVYALLGSARLTVRIADDFVGSIDQKFSVLVESLTTGVPISVEVARYQSPVSFGGSGGAASATRIR